MSCIEMMGPGPEERKLRSRLYRWWFGRWPQAVVRERLNDPRWDAWTHGPVMTTDQMADSWEREARASGQEKP